MANTLKFGNGEWYGKKDTILAYNDLNSNYKPLPFDFIRGSSATVINKDGLIETVGSGEPRIDYKDNSKGALLLEPSRGNLVKSSGDISTQSTYWLSNQGGTSVQNATTAPDGSNTASQINTFGQQYGGITQGSISVSNNEYTYSIYLKAKNGTPNIRLIFFDGVTFHSSDFTILSEWKRYDYKFTPVSGSFQIYITCPYVKTSFYAWGAQVEQGSYATSYIPTQGTAQTRLADSCTQTVPDGVIGQTEGTLFLDFEKQHNAVEVWSINDDTVSNRVYLGFNGSNFISQVRSSGGSSQAFFSTPINNDTRYKCAIAYKQNDFVLYINGVQIGTDNSGVVPLNMSKLSAYSSNSSDAPFFSPTNEVKLYNTRLSNSELAALTQV